MEFQFRAQFACLPNSFRQYQIILLCYGLLEGFYIQQRRDPELTPCQHELKFDVLPVTPPRYVTHLYVCCKISGKFIRPTTVFCGTDLLYQTQHEIQITAGSGSMSESLVDTSMSVQYCCVLVFSILSQCQQVSKMND